MKEVVIVSACRTAIGAFGGALKDLNGGCLGNLVTKLLKGVRNACWLKQTL